MVLWGQGYVWVVQGTMSHPGIAVLGGHHGGRVASWDVSLLSCLPATHEPAGSRGRQEKAAHSPLMSTPKRAPTPVPTMTAVGVARPRAHGQAMTNTAMPNSKANKNGVCPSGSQEEGYRPLRPAMYLCGLVGLAYSMVVMCAVVVVVVVGLGGSGNKAAAAAAAGLQRSSRTTRAM
jgi:hypothetical protein